MLILSFEFYASLVIILAVYWLLPSRHRWGVLLFASVAFSVAANKNSLKACGLMLAMILMAYGAGRLFERIEAAGKRKLVMLAAVVLEIGLLIRLKEIGFFLNLFHYEGPFGLIDWVVPLGISYWTLSLVSYVLDVYWGVEHAEKSPFRFALFGGYFPLLTSGPIVRYGEVAPELFGEHRFDYDRFCSGVQRILWGFFKKLVISERLGVVVNTIYGDPVTYSGIYVWMAVILFVGQLYTDFSGCIDIILGISELFGVRLPENFNLPFSAKSISEFWQRWHITLGLWVKNYVFYPVLKSDALQRFGRMTKRTCGKRLGKKLPVWVGLFFTWFVIGFWHGGAWHYVIGVGMWMWFVIVLGEATEPYTKRASEFLGINTECFSYRLFESVRTFLLYAFGNGFFRAQSLTWGIDFYRAGLEWNPWIFFDGSLFKLGLTDSDWHVLIVSFLLLALSAVVRIQTGGDVRAWIARQNLVFRWTLWLALLFFVLTFGMYGPSYDLSAFIYFKF